MQTFRVPVMEWTRRDKHHGRNTLLKPSSQVIKGCTGHFGMAPGEALVEEQHIQDLCTHLLSFQQITQCLFSKQYALDSQHHLYCGGDTGVTSLWVGLGCMGNLQHD